MRELKVWKLEARRLLMCSCLVLLAGCAQLLPSPKEVVREPQADRPKIERLLMRAETALAANRLSTPTRNNAYDLFRAVLLLKPGHPQARSGLQAVVLRYLELIRAAAARGEYDAAFQLIDKAKRVDADSPPLLQLERQLLAQRRVEQQQLPRLDDAAVRVFPLVLAELDKRSDSLIDYLQAIARQVRFTRESVLIVARSDAEGRWIYQRMREAVKGYRLRGDILIEPVPRLVLQAPLD